MNRLTDPAYLRPLLARHGFSFQKSLGQNFLIDPAVPARQAEAAGLDEDTCVLEIGPGVGTLTYELCRRAKRVAAIELDRRLIPLLGETMEEFSNFSLISGDALKLDLGQIAREQFGEAPFVVCANLPYYITSPMLMKLFETRLAARQITVLIQREVAARFAAAPGTSDYGAITAAAAYYTRCERLFDVPPEAFLPAPKVTSTVIAFTPIAPPVSVENEAELFRLIRAAFAQRRKTLLNCLTGAYKSEGWDKASLQALLEACGMEANVRGEALSLADFARICNEMQNFREKMNF